MVFKRIKELNYRLDKPIFESELEPVAFEMDSFNRSSTSALGNP